MLVTSRNHKFKYNVKMMNPFTKNKILIFHPNVAYKCSASDLHYYEYFNDKHFQQEKLHLKYKFIQFSENGDEWSERKLTLKLTIFYHS